MFKALFLASLFVTLMVNIMFLFATKDKPPDSISRDNRTQVNQQFEANSKLINKKFLSRAAIDEKDYKVRVFPLHNVDENDKNHNTSSCERENKNQPKNSLNMTMLHIRVKSSRNHVFVSVNHLVIYESKSAAKAKEEEEEEEEAAKSLLEQDTNYNLVDNSNSILQHSQQNDAKEPIIQVDNLSDVVREDSFDADADAVAVENADADADANVDDEFENGRGIHVVVLNEFNGLMMAQRVFDTYSPGQDVELTSFIHTVRDGRILVFAIKDEGSFKMANDSSARYLLQKLGSQHIMRLGWRDMWAFVTPKRSFNVVDDDDDDNEQSLGVVLRGKQLSSKKPITYGEILMKSSKFSQWAQAAVVDAEIKLDCQKKTEHQNCSWAFGDNQVDRRRAAFCGKIEGYAKVCDCEQPARIEFNPVNIYNSQLDGVPIVVMASNRPYYLYRMLRSLLAADGVNSSMVSVFIDGFYEDPLIVSQLFNLRVIQQKPLSKRSARISHHYKSSLTATFDSLFPKAEYAIIFEEDLDVSPDIMVYFNQTLSLLRQDPSLYCSSAWNDQGYQHSIGNDPGLLYRIETMPGLGWMLSRKLYKQELEPNWPPVDQHHDWDMWIRTESVRKQRECIIPDISRTFHFGSIGTNINSYFQNQYFSQHALFNYSKYSQNGPTKFHHLDKLTKESYEKYIEKLINEAQCLNQINLDGQQSLEEFLCSLADDPPRRGSDNETNNNNATSSVIYIDMIDEHDYTNWLKLAKCWRIWDLDARGQHKSMWRLFLSGKPVFVVGVPASPYAKFKPIHVKPFKF